MPVKLDSERGRTGTKFKLFPQPRFLEPFEEPETVWVSPPTGSVGPGPADERMYVIDPVDKGRPYGISRGPYGSLHLYLPPWDGSIHPPAIPNQAGHFDHLEVGTPEFEAAHLYGTARLVLDIWEHYFGRRIDWHFRPDYDRLEMLLLRPLDNARVGYGFMEVGSYTTEAGTVRPFSLNFDVLAHELGHLIIYTEVGVPTAATEQGEYFGFHESAADLTALVSVLHFDSVVDDLLETTRGNLYTLNRLNRIAELSKTEQIRIASNDVKLSDFADGWTDEHDLSQPLTGAIFDVFVDMFHESLLDRELISAYVEDLADQVERRPEYADLIQSLFDEAYEQEPAGFKQALLEARDHMGLYLAGTWSRLSPHYLGYDDVGVALLDVDRELTAGRYQRIIQNNFLRRDIGAVVAGPRLSPPTAASHVYSARTVLPRDERYFPRLSFRERWELAQTAAVRSGTWRDKAE